MLAFQFAAVVQQAERSFCKSQVAGSIPAGGSTRKVKDYKGGSGMQDADRNEVSIAMKRLNKFRGVISSQQYRTIKGQIVAGDTCGAYKGLRKIVGVSFYYKEERA